jgi:signal transduction histidine kinase
VALTLRYRASTGVVRQQLKWFVAGAIPTVVLIIAYHVIPGVAGGVIAMVASLPLLAGVTVAIRRYRLYDIDRLVSTTVAYLSLSALLVAIYGLSATALGQLFGSAGGGSTVAVAGSAVVVTALFDPLRRRLQHASDRYFRRRNYEATRVVGRYLDRLREHEPEPGALRDTIRIALADPGAEIALWLPYHSGYVTERGEAVDVPTPEGDVSITRVDRAGAHLGVVIRDRSARADPGSAAGALRAAAAAFDHARLAAQVMVQVAEVRAARTRILVAGDVERRRVERNLHDGAQQHLVGLSLELGRLRTEATQGGHTDLVERIAGAASQAGAALRELRELARGLHPAILTEQGLVAAIASLAERSLTPVAIRADIDRRYAPLVETTAYYVVAEALTNVAKHAQATKVSVVVAEESGRLRVEVSDDGVGGARSDVESGLAGLEDRIEALGGRLVVVSPPGAGTALVAELPL